MDNAIGKLFQQPRRQWVVKFSLSMVSNHMVLRGITFYNAFGAGGCTCVTHPHITHPSVVSYSTSLTYREKILSIAYKP